MQELIFLNNEFTLKKRTKYSNEPLQKDSITLTDYLKFIKLN